MSSNFPWTKRLEDRITLCGNAICMGLDPVVELMPVNGSIEERLRRFYLEILGEMVRRKVCPAVVKPNSAYFECLGIGALQVLQELIRQYQQEGIPVILDAKRGDIGKSSEAYAKAAFDVFGADAITVSPWMGADSVKPFLRPDRGVYILLRTSNGGAADFQDLALQEGGPAFLAVAAKILEWNHGGLGAVVGATKPGELENITRWFVSRGVEIPFLIPGVSMPGVPGGQGGDVASVRQALGFGGSSRLIHVYNSSSGINYAWQARGKPEKFASTAVDALERLATL